MNTMRRFIYRILNKSYYLTVKLFSQLYLLVTLPASGIIHGENLQINGFPRFIIHPNGKLRIGDSFRMNSGKLHNPIGRNQRCLISVSDMAELKIGNHVGMSSVAIICQKQITIGNHVKIGGNTLIYDTDFHSLNAAERSRVPEIAEYINKKPVIIGDHVFIGGHSIILKGSIIGEYSIVGAGSVVSGTIPPYELWAGNPARFIRKLSSEVTQQSL